MKPKIRPFNNVQRSTGAQTILTFAEMIRNAKIVERLTVIAEKFKGDDFDETTLLVFAHLAKIDSLRIDGKRGVSQRCVFERSSDTVNLRPFSGCPKAALFRFIKKMSDPSEIRENVAARFNINERFEFIEELTTMVAQKAVRGLVVTGSGGLGKSYTVEQKLEGQQDVIVTKGYISARALFDQLASYPEAIHVFDDADAVVEDKSSVNLLKAAIDTGNRTVHWNTFNQDTEPFEFKGSVIIISNKRLVDFPQPILSRSLFVDVTMTADEKMQRIEHILPHIDDDLEPEEQREVLDVMYEFRNLIDDLNVRTYLKVAAVKNSGSPRWRDIAIYQLTTKVEA